MYLRIKIYKYIYIYILHPRPIMLTFKENDTKMQVLKKSSFLRGSRFALSEDYDSVVREKRKKLYDHFKHGY